MIDVHSEAETYWLCYRMLVPRALNHRQMRNPGLAKNTEIHFRQASFHRLCRRHLNLNRRFEPRARLRRKPENFHLIDFRQSAPFDNDFSIGNHAVNAAPVLAEDQLTGDIVQRCESWSIAPQQDDIGEFSRRERTDIETKRTRAVARGHRKRLHGCDPMIEIAARLVVYQR